MTRTQQLLPLLIGLLILVAIGFLPVSLPRSDETNTQVLPQEEAANAPPPRPIGEIFAGVTVAQEFPAAGTAIRTAALLLATYQRANSGAIQVLMQAQANGQWQTLGSQTMEKMNLQNNALNTVTFDPPLAVERGQIIRIVLQADGNEQNAISWWMNPAYQRPGFALFLNGDPQPGTAQFQIAYARASGRLATMIGPVWARITIFLDPLWRMMLIVGALVLFGSFLVLGRYLPGTVAASPPLSSGPVRTTEEEACSPSPSFVGKEPGECNEESQSTEPHTA